MEIMPGDTNTCQEDVLIRQEEMDEPHPPTMASRQVKPIKPNPEDPRERIYLSICPIAFCGYNVNGRMYHPAGESCGLKRICLYYCQGNCRSRGERCNCVHVKMPCHGWMRDGACDVHPSEPIYSTHLQMHEHGERDENGFITDHGLRILGIHAWMFKSLQKHIQNPSLPVELMRDYTHVCPGRETCRHGLIESQPLFPSRGLSHKTLFDEAKLQYHVIQTTMLQNRNIFNNGVFVIPQNYGRGKCCIGTLAALIELSHWREWYLVINPFRNLSLHQLALLGLGIFPPYGLYQPSPISHCTWFKFEGTGFKIFFGKTSVTFRNRIPPQIMPTASLLVSRIASYVGEEMIYHLLNLVYPTKEFKFTADKSSALVTYASAEEATIVSGLFQGFPFGNSRLLFRSAGSETREEHTRRVDISHDQQVNVSYSNPSSLPRSLDVERPSSYLEPPSVVVAKVPKIIIHEADDEQDMGGFGGNVRSSLAVSTYEAASCYEDARQQFKLDQEYGGYRGYIIEGKAFVLVTEREETISFKKPTRSQDCSDIISARRHIRRGSCPEFL